MKVVQYSEVPGEDPGGETRGVTIRWLISAEDGAPNYYMRVFEISPGGHSPLHRHPWEHEIYILSGEAELVGEEGSVTVGPDTAVYIAGDELHQLRNRGREVLRFICTIPASGA